MAELLESVFFSHIITRRWPISRGYDILDTELNACNLLQDYGAPGQLPGDTPQGMMAIACGVYGAWEIVLWHFT